MPSDSTHTPLVFSLLRLLDARGRSDAQWATFLGCDAELVEGIRAGHSWPGDSQMTSILRDMERTKGSRNAGDTSAALDHFWTVISRCEVGTLPFELPLENGETVSQRVTRWTNCGWIENTRRNIHLIPPRRRAAYVDAARELFNRFTEE